jgi:hypothetical protein
MNRRSLLQAAPVAGLLAALPRFSRAQSTGQPGWRTFEIVTKLEINGTAGPVRAWVPLPLTYNTPFFQPISTATAGNAERADTYIDPVYGAAMVAATFKADETQPVIEVVNRFRTRDWATDLKPGSGP